VEKTQRAISNFMNRRSDQITSNEPALVSRLGNSSSNGNFGLVSFSGQGNLQYNNLAVATSLRQVIGSNQAKKDRRRRELGQMMPFGVQSASGTTTPQSGFDVWITGK
jgi:hypothetical protein